MLEALNLCCKHALKTISDPASAHNKLINLCETNEQRAEVICGLVMLHMETALKESSADILLKDFIMSKYPSPNHLDQLGEILYALAAGRFHAIQVSQQELNEMNDPPTADEIKDRLKH